MKCPTHTYIVGTLADEIQAQYEKNRWPHGKPVRKHNALDDLFSAERREREKKEKVMSSDLFSESEENNSTEADDTDSSGNGTQFAHRTGVFSLDFPDSPRVPKGKGKKSKESPPVGTTSIADSNGSQSDGGPGERCKQVTFGSPSLKQRESDIISTDSDITTIMATKTQELTVSIPTAPNSDSDFHIRPSGFITNCKRRRRSSSSCNRDHFKWTKAETVASDERGEAKYTLICIIYQYKLFSLMALLVTLQKSLSAISSSYGGHTTSYFTTDDSESDQRDGDVANQRHASNAYGQCKTSRYKRPPCDKKVLEQRKKIATRHSSRIKQLLDEKKKLDEVSDKYFNKYS